MAEGIIYPKGVVPRNEDFREAQKMRGEVYNFLKNTMEETAESAFHNLGYDQKAAPAGFYGDGSAYGFGVDEGVYNVKVGSKTDSYLEKRMSLGGKRIVVEMHMTIFPESMTVEMHYKNTEDAAFRGFQEGKGGYMINEKIIMNCANMEKFKTEMTKKLKEFAEKEIGFITMTKLGNDDRMEKSTASVVEGFTLSSMFSDDFDATSNKIMEMTQPNIEKKDDETDDLLLGDEMNENKYVGILQSLGADWGADSDVYHAVQDALVAWGDKNPEAIRDVLVNYDVIDDFQEYFTTAEITSAGGAGSAGAFGYDAPLGAPRKRTLKTSAPFDQTVNENRTLPNKSEIIKGYEDANQGSVDEKYINDIIDKFANTANASDIAQYIQEFGNAALGYDLWFCTNGHSGGFQDRGSQTVGFEEIGNRLALAGDQGGKEVRAAFNEALSDAPSPKPRIRQQNNPTDAEIDAKTQRGIDGRAAERNRPRPRPVPNPIDETNTINRSEIEKGFSDAASLNYPSRTNAQEREGDKEFLNNVINAFVKLANPSDISTYLNKFTYFDMGYDLWFAVNGHNGGFQDRNTGDFHRVVGNRLSQAGMQAGQTVLNMNENQKRFEDTPYARRMRENRRPTNHTRIIPEGTDGFWQVVSQDTLDAYKKNHIIGAPGAEGVEVNSKEEEEYNSGGVQKFPGGKSHKYDLKENEHRNRQKHHAWSYLQGANTPVVVNEIADSKTFIIFENANPASPEVEANGYKVMEVPQVLELMENGGYHAMLVGAHTIHQESVNESVSKRYKKVKVKSQTELNERWKRLATMGDAETIHEAESVIPDRKDTPAPKRPITESVEGLNSLSRDGGIEEGETVDGKLVIEIEKPNCLAPVFYKVFKEDYENKTRAFVWDFNTGMLVNNPGFEVK